MYTLSNDVKQKLDAVLFLSDSLAKRSTLFDLFEGVVRNEVKLIKKKVRSKRTSEGMHTNARKRRPNEYHIDDHAGIAAKMFWPAADEEPIYYDRETMINRLMEEYQVGRNRVEEREGFLNYLVASGLIRRRIDGLFCWGELPVEQ